MTLSIFEIIILTWLFGLTLSYLKITTILHEFIKSSGFTFQELKQILGNLHKEIEERKETLKKMEIMKK